jgi:hypothetical protein
MSIKPIDLQTNIGQLIEVGRGEQARSGAITEQQHVREEQSSQKGRNVQNRLDENEKADQRAIHNDEKNESGGKGREKEKREEEGQGGKKGSISPHPGNDTMGRFIDVLK